VGINKIKYSYNANSLSELTNEQIQEIINYGISSKKLLLEMNHMTEISETTHPKKILPISDRKIENSSFTHQITLAKIDNDDNMYFYFKEKGEKEINKIKTDDDIDMYFYSENEEENEMNEKMPKVLALLTDDDNDCSHNNNSEEEISNNSDDDGYNKYDEYDRGYYYNDRRYKRKTFPMMSSIISLITT